MVKFIILTEIRTGYKWLASLLSSHPQAFCFGELFCSGRGVRQASMFDKPMRAIKEKEDPVIWLKENIEKWGQEENLDVLGFKVNYVDGKYNKKWDSLWEYIKELKIIHLTRKNLIDRALSEFLANKEKNWANEDYKSEIYIEPNHLLRIIHRSENWQKNARIMFKGMFEITYEQIQSQPKRMIELQRYLELTPQLLGSEQKKQRQYKQSHYIENYSEIRDMIRKYFPCYENMLDHLDHKEIKM